MTIRFLPQSNNIEVEIPEEGVSHMITVWNAARSGIVAYSDLGRALIAPDTIVECSGRGPCSCERPPRAVRYAN